MAPIGAQESKMPVSPFYLSPEARARLRLHAILMRIKLRVLREQRAMGSAR